MFRFENVDEAAGAAVTDRPKPPMSGLSARFVKTISLLFGTVQSRTGSIDVREWTASSCFESSPMSDAEFLANARMCDDLATAARKDEERTAWLRMKDVWLARAAQEGAGGDEEPKTGIDSAQP